MKTNKFIGAVLASAIALTTAFSAPASAASEGENLAKVLLGAVAVGAIVHAAKKDKRRDHVSNQYHYTPPNNGYYNHRPRNCLRKKYTQYGWKTFYSQKCLKRYRAQGHRNGHGYKHGYHKKYHKHYNGHHVYTHHHGGKR